MVPYNIWDTHILENYSLLIWTSELTVCLAFLLAKFSDSNLGNVIK